MKFSTLKYLCILLCLFFSTLVSSQGLNDLYSKLSNAENDAKKVSVLRTLMQVFPSKDSINHYAQQALLLGKKLNDTESLAETTITKGYAYHRLLREHDSGQYFIRRGIQKAPDSDKIGAKGNYALANTFTDLRKIDSAVFYYEKALTYDVEKFPNLKYDIVYHLAKVYAYTGKLEKAEKLFQETLTYYLSEDKHQFSVETYIELGLIKTREAKYDLAIGYYDKALALSKKINDEILTNTILLEFSSVLKQNKEYDKALKYLEESLAFFKKRNDIEAIVVAQTRMGIALGEQKKHQEAIKVFLEALEYAKKSINKDHWTLLIYQNIAPQYASVGKYDSSILYSQKAIDYWNQKPDGEIRVSSAYLNIAFAYNQKKEYKKAEQSILKAIDISEKNNLTEMKIIMYKALAENYELQKNYRKALVYYQRHKAINDSVFSVQKNKTINELQVKYDTEKKEKEILDLSKTTEVQSLELKSSRYLIIGLALFLSLLLIVLFLVMKDYKRRIKQRKTELQLYLLQKQMSPHFISNALSSIQHSILKDDKKVAYNFHSKFSSLIRNILSSSVKNKITLQEEIDMLKNYVEIENLRLDNSFSFSIEIDPEINTESTIIPIMLFQPHVENAIFHGLVPSDNKHKELSIDIRKENGYLYCLIQDNGIGIKRSRMGKIQDSDSHALHIFKERIQLFNRKIAYTIADLSDQKNNQTGTLVSIQISMN